VSQEPAHLLHCQEKRREIASWVGGGGGIRALYELSVSMYAYKAFAATIVLNVSLNEALSKLT
jgi:uncharacterized membrane protein